MYKIVQTGNFTFSFPVWLPFISFSCPNAPARTSSAVSCGNGDAGQPCLVPNLRRKGFSFLPLSVMLAMGLLYMAFLILQYIHSVPS